MLTLLEFDSDWFQVVISFRQTLQILLLTLKNNLNYVIREAAHPKVTNEMKRSGKIKEQIKVYQKMIVNCKGESEARPMQETVKILMNQSQKLDKVLLERSKNRLLLEKMKMAKPPPKKPSRQKRVRAIFDLYGNKYIMIKRNRTFEEQRKSQSRLNF